MFFTERVAIKEELEFIREERRKLTDRYWDLITRLKELDAEDRARGQFIDIEGAFQSIHEITKELSFAISYVHKKIPMDIENEELSLIQDNQVADKETVRNQQKDDNTILERKNKDLKKIAQLVASFLKEKGVPVRINTIFKYLMDDYGYYWGKTSYSWTFKQLMQYEPKIISSSRGYYQYKL